MQGEFERPDGHRMKVLYPHEIRKTECRDEAPQKIVAKIKPNNRRVLWNLLKKGWIEMVGVGVTDINRVG